MTTEIKITIIAIIIIILLIYVIAIRNLFVKLTKKIDSSKSLVDVFLKKRYDLIPNLVEVCKGYSNYENSTLKEIIELRKGGGNYYNNLIANIEKYPELKASASYLTLQKELTNVEDELQASRRIYINSITKYNNLVMKIPSSIIAKVFGYRQKELFIFDDDNNININFDKN